METFQRLRGRKDPEERLNLKEAETESNPGKTRHEKPCSYVTPSPKCSISFLNLRKEGPSLGILQQPLDSMNKEYDD